MEGWTAALSPWSLGRAAGSGGCGAFSHLSPAPAGMDGVAAVALAGPRSRGPVQPCGGLAGQTQVTQRLQTARQETGHLRRKHGFFGLWRESVTHRGSRNQQATRGGVFPTQTKRRTGTMGLGEPAGAGLPENRVKRLRGRSPAHSSPMLLPGRCPIHRAAASPPAPRAAGPRMWETPGTAALQTLLRHLHPGLAGRSRAASVEEHVCACGTALWTHIRSLVRKGKVGLRGPGIPGVGGTGQGPGSVPLLAVLVSVLEEEGRGGMGRRAQGSPASGGNQKGRLSAALSPLLKLHVGMPRWVQWFGCHASLQRARLLRSKRYTAWLDKFLFLIKIIKLPQWRDPVPFLGSRGH